MKKFIIRREKKNQTNVKDLFVFVYNIINVYHKLFINELCNSILPNFNQISLI